MSDEREKLRDVLVMAQEIGSEISETDPDAGPVAIRAITRIGYNFARKCNPSMPAWESLSDGAQLDIIVWFGAEANRIYRETFT